MAIQTLGQEYYGAINRVMAEKKIAWRLAGDAAFRLPRSLGIPIMLKNPTQINTVMKLAEPLALAAGVESVITQRTRRLINFQFELPQSEWRFFSKEDFGPDVVGVSRISRRGNDVIRFGLSHENPHTLVAGMTGSGKTEAARTILLALLLANSPAHLKIGIADVKQSKFSELSQSAHLAAPIAKSPADIAKLIEYFRQQFAHRQANAIMANNAGHLPAGVPRLLLVLDECQDSAIVGQHRNFNEGNLAALQIIARQGREYGVHLLMGTQKPKEANLPDLLPNMANRFVGKVSDATTSANVVGIPQVGAEKLTGKGDFLYICNGVQRFQAVMSEAADFAKLPLAANVPPPVMLCEESDPHLVIPEVAPAGGRPPIAIDYKIVAYYIVNNLRVPAKVALRKFGLKRRGHDKHKEVAAQILNEMKRLFKLKREA